MKVKLGGKVIVHVTAKHVVMAIDLGRTRLRVMANDVLRVLLATENGGPLKGVSRMVGQQFARIRRGLVVVAAKMLK